MTDEQESPTDGLAVARPAGGGLVPGVVGVLLCVLLITGVGMLIAQFMGGHDDQPGPGAFTVAAHLAGAAVGWFCYRLSRRPGRGRLAGLLGIIVVTGLLLWFFWWSPA
ncbi:MAG TPA: hypothetical protein VFX16_02875 [Pseudonocardiaceae bacterium]|nr:hypothetical protein [Pseudonocardiaceae bacterium]